MRCRAHLGIDVENAAVRADVERPPRREAARAEDAVRAGHIFGRVTENGTGQIESRREIRVGLHRVDARGEALHAASGERRRELAERSALRRASAGERFWK